MIKVDTLSLEAFEKRKLSHEQAKLISHFAYDLGDKSKLLLRMALAGPTKEHLGETVDVKTFDFIAYRRECYLQLDATSRIIVENILSDDIEGAITNFDYLIKVFTSARNTLNLLRD